MMPVRRNQNWLPDIFSDFFDNNWMERVNQTLPAVNVLENEKEYRVELAAPGLTKDDFNVHVRTRKDASCAASSLIPSFAGH